MKELRKFIFNASLITISYSRNMMLRSKYLLLIILWFVGAQFVASQVVVLDSVKSDSVVLQHVDSLATDTMELADAEFEAWLEQYAQITDSGLQITDDSLSVDVVKDSVEKKDFVSLSKEGEEAREKEKNALIIKVMESMRKKKEVVDERVEKDSMAIVSSSVSFELDNTPKSVHSIFATTDLVSLFYDNYFLAAKDILSEIDKDFVYDSTSVNPLFLDWVLGDVGQGAGMREYGIWSDDSIVVEVRKGVKEYIRATEPELYAYHESQLPSITELQMGHIQYDKRDKLLLNLDSLNKARTSNLKVDLPEMSKWSKGAKFQVHASQNYISSNWYKGGESNMAMTMYAMGYFNYDNRKGLQWDNKAEWKLGLYGMSSDSLRWLRVNEDLLRLNSKLGYKAFKKFFYTAEWDFQTSLFNTYKSNTYIRSSGPFSPIRMSLSLGMDYKWNSMVSVFVSPLSYKLIYVADMSYKEGVLLEENIAHQVGITDGTRQSNQLGALVRTDFDYDFNESIGMEVHFSFFGNYVGKIKGVEVGCEVIGNFKINRFLSAKVSLYPRYDSTTIPADGGKPKMQFYELISLGFNYKL